MLAFVAPRLVLLSVPKTGTTALESALAAHAQLVMRARPEIKHLTLRQYGQHVAPLLDTIPGKRFRTIAVVREPVSWLGSWYRYRARPQAAGSPNSTAALDFERFVQDYLAADRPRHARLGRQSGFLTPAPGKPPVDLLFQYEQLDRLVAFLSDALDTAIDLPVVNVSPARDLSLSDTTAARLHAALAEDYVLWESAGRPVP